MLGESSSAVKMCVCVCAHEIYNLVKVIGEDHVWNVILIYIFPTILNIC